MAAIRVAGFEMVAPRHFTLFRVLDPDTAGTRISDLARDADVSRQAVQQVVAESETLGILETLGDPDDGRVRLVRYTAFGREGFLRCMAEFARLEGRVRAAVGRPARRGVAAGSARSRSGYLSPRAWVGRRRHRPPRATGFGLLTELRGHIDNGDHA